MTPTCLPQTAAVYTRQTVSERDEPAGGGKGEGEALRWYLLHGYRKEEWKDGLLIDYAEIERETERERGG